MQFINRIRRAAELLAAGALALAFLPNCTVDNESASEYETAEMTETANAELQQWRSRYVVLNHNGTSHLFEENIPANNGFTNWALAPGWTEVTDPQELPGSGLITALDKFVDDNGILHEYIYRGGQIHYRSGEADRWEHGGYVNIGSVSEMPGDGISTFGSARTPDGLSQYYWTAGRSYWRVLNPYSTAIVSPIQPLCAQQNSYGCWNENPGDHYARLVELGLSLGQPISSSWGAHEGGGSMFQAFALQRFDNGQVEMQWRNIPIVDERPDYQCHTYNGCPWTKAQPMPIEGTVAGQADYLRTPAGACGTTTISLESSDFYRTSEHFCAGPRDSYDFDYPCDHYETVAPSRVVMEDDSMVLYFHVPSAVEAVGHDKVFLVRADEGPTLYQIVQKAAGGGHPLERPLQFVRDEHLHRVYKMVLSWPVRRGNHKYGIRCMGVGSQFIIDDALAYARLVIERH